MKNYDLVIVGAGPAGLTAAIYAARNKMDFVVISDGIGGQMAWSGIIENYSGYSHITGPELTELFLQHTQAFNTLINQNEVVKSIEKKNNLVEITTNRSVYLAKSVIICSGNSPKKLNVPGEKEFTNRGVSYCATCDGPLFTGKNVAIVGGGNSALDAALQLANLTKKLYIINKNPMMKGDAIMFEKAKDKGVTFIYNANTTEIIGNRVVNGIEFESEGEKNRLDVDGVFVEIGLLPNSQFINCVNKNEYNEIIVNGNNETNVPGIYAAGDVTNISSKQIITSAGDGSKALIHAFKYIVTNFK